MAYFPSVSFYSSSNQFGITFPNSSGNPSVNAYWAIVSDSSSNYYLMRFNLSGGFSCSNLNSSTVSLDNRTPDWFDSDIDLSSGDPIYYALTPIGSVSTSTKKFIINTRRPLTADISTLSNLCNTVSTISSSSTNIFFINQYTPVDSDSGSGSVSVDYTLPILMIPATLICLAFMFCIFKLFINKRLRS